MEVLDMVRVHAKLLAAQRNVNLSAANHANLVELMRAAEQEYMAAVESIAPLIYDQDKMEIMEKK